MILTVKDLAHILRERCDKAKYRIWIASPFIGNLKGVKKIIGGSFMKSSIEFKIVTDVDAGFIKEDTFNEFKKYKSDIFSLKSLHAKVYIIDDWCLMTSANLTATAFSRRYEIGTEISNSKEIREIEEIFKDWIKLGEKVESVPVKQVNSCINEYHEGTSFKVLCKLKPFFKKALEKEKYLEKIHLYKEFSKYYENITGRCKQMVDDGFLLYQEVDYFFNYLYHEDKLTPSKGINKVKIISEKEKEDKLKRYFSRMKKFYPTKKEKFRVENTSLFKDKLSSENINNLTEEDVKKLLDCFHCYNRRTYHITNIIEKNKKEDIIFYWGQLLRLIDKKDENLDEVIKEVKKNIFSFNDSGVQELIGWYSPENYPLINKNSNSGMRFFGYNV